MLTQSHFPTHLNFDLLDFFSPINVSSDSRARAFLWLCYYYHEAPSRNPFDDDYSRKHPGLIPSLDILSSEEALLENLDTAEEKAWGESMTTQRRDFMSMMAMREKPHTAPAPSRDSQELGEEFIASLAQKPMRGSRARGRGRGGRGRGRDSRSASTNLPGPSYSTHTGGEVYSYPTHIQAELQSQDAHQGVSPQSVAPCLSSLYLGPGRLRPRLPSGPPEQYSRSTSPIPSPPSKRSPFLDHHHAPYPISHPRSNPSVSPEPLSRSYGGESNQSSHGQPIRNHLRGWSTLNRTHSPGEVLPSLRDVGLLSEFNTTREFPPLSIPPPPPAYLRRQRSHTPPPSHPSHTYAFMNDSQPTTSSGAVLPARSMLERTFTSRRTSTYIHF